MAAEGCEAFCELPLRAYDLLNGRREVVVDDPPRNPSEVREGPHMGIQERELVAAVVEPHEVASGVHKAHHELPSLPPPAALLGGDLEEVHLGFVSGAMDQRDEDLGRLAALLPEVVAHGGDADLVAFLHELAVDP